jgi:hypothetical protein
MNKQVNFAKDFKPNFSGHETFSLRYGWLEKSFQAVENNDENPFTKNDAIAKFGVGKNMVNAIKHWALATGFLESAGDTYAVSGYARKIMDPSADPFLENADSIWKIHYELAKNPRNTTIYFLFNYLNENVFDRSTIATRLLDFLVSNELKAPAEKTITSDITVSLSNYSNKLKKTAREEDINCPLSELRLIRSIGDGRYSFNFGSKSSLSQQVFLSCVIDFWHRSSEQSTSNGNTLRFEQILHAPGSPGRLFLLNEKELVTRLENIELLSDGHLIWSETAGIQQLIKTAKFNHTVLDTIWERAL